MDSSSFVRAVMTSTMRIQRDGLSPGSVARGMLPRLAGLLAMVAVLCAPAARAQVGGDYGGIGPALEGAGSLMAAADDGGFFLNLGPVLTITPEPSGGRTLALGGEGSLHYLHPKEKCLFQESCVLGLGAFAQVQPLGEGQLRWSGGLQATYDIVGLELGYSRELETDDRPGVSGLQVAPFLTLGVFSASVRYTFPLSPEVRGQRQRGADVAYMLTLKLPIPLGES